MKGAKIDVACESGRQNIRNKSGIETGDGEIMAGETSAKLPDNQYLTLLPAI